MCNNMLMKYQLGAKRRRRFVLPVLLILLLCAGGALIWQVRSSTSVPVTSEFVEAPETTRTLTAQIVFLGDTMLGRVVGPAILAGDDPFRHVRPILDTYDYRIANIESVIADPSVTTTPANKRYTFNAPLGVLDAIAGVPIDLSILANNHTGDYGRPAMLDMLSQFDLKGLHHTGLGRDIDAAFRPFVTELEMSSDQEDLPTAPVKIAVIAFNDFENVFSDARAGTPGSAFYDQVRLASSISTAKADGAELVFVVPHWGAEFRLDSFTARQQQIGRWLIDNGADAVVGGHPHVIQPTEIYQGKPIIYSLGNFVFSGMESIPHTGRGQMAGFEITMSAKFRGNKMISATDLQLSEPIYHFYNLDLNGYPIPE